MKLIVSATMMLLLLFVVGCFPVHQTVSPSVAGVVIDAQTYAPVSGAQAVVAYSGYPPPTTPEAFTNTRPPIVFTKSDGSFMIPSGQRRIWVTVLPIDCFYPVSTLLVRADGYVPAVIPITTIGARATNISKIYLTPKR
jgi:hypothetical protein